MAEKQYADKSFMAEYSSYLKEHALDPISRVIEIDGNASVAALHLPPQEADPYFVMTSADNTKSIQLMTNGAWGGNDADGTGMGIRFFSSDGSGALQGYGNLALKAEPAHGWDYVLTLPNETGTLATRNYADDAVASLQESVDDKVTTQQIGYTRDIIPSAQDEYNLYSIPNEATGVEADFWFFRGTTSASTNLYIGFGTTSSNYPHASWATIQYADINASQHMNTAPHLKMFMSRKPGSVAAKYMIIDMDDGSNLPTTGTSSYLIDKIVCDKPQNARIFGIVRVYLKGEMAPQIVQR